MNVSPKFSEQRMMRGYLLEFPQGNEARWFRRNFFITFYKPFRARVSSELTWKVFLSSLGKNNGDLI